MKSEDGEQRVLGKESVERLPDSEWVQVMERYRLYLQRLAYRLLGSVADSEDVVQDVFIRLSQMGMPNVLYMKAYLVKIVTNRCLNHMRSMRRKKETYVGPWLPEPLRDGEYEADEPLAAVERRESLSYAYLVMLERLTPLERAVFVLREALGFEYAEIAQLIDKTGTNCRKLFSRAGSKMEGVAGAVPDRPLIDHTPFVEAFLRASRTGDFHPLVRFMLEDAAMVSDGGGKVSAAVRPIEGRDRVIAFFQGIAGKGRLGGDIHPFRMNGQLGLRLMKDGKTMFVILLESEVDSGLINRLYIMRNPDKLAKL